MPPAAAGMMPQQGYGVAQPQYFAAAAPQFITHAPIVENYTWVKCEATDCGKWRKLPIGVDAESLPDPFYCFDLEKIDPAHADCLIEEEPSNDHVPLAQGMTPAAAPAPVAYGDDEYDEEEEGDVGGRDDPADDDYYEAPQAKKMKY